MNWDSVTMKTPEILRAQIGLMKDLGEHHHLTSGKDISNPGIIGTLGMLLESSGVGAIVDLTAIPRPDLDALGLTFEQWVRMYPGMGFIMTMDQSQIDIVCKKFRATGMAAQVIGTVNNTKRLTLVKGKTKIELFDFCKESITNI
jgi:selenophosphate synthetase-related protein